MCAIKPSSHQEASRPVGGRRHLLCICVEASNEPASRPQANNTPLKPGFSPFLSRCLYVYQSLTISLFLHLCLYFALSLHLVLSMCLSLNIFSYVSISLARLRGVLCFGVHGVGAGLVQQGREEAVQLPDGGGGEGGGGGDGDTLVEEETARNRQVS